MQLERLDKIVTVLIGIFGLVYVYLMLPYPAEAKLVPLIFAAVLILTVVIQLLGGYLPFLRAITSGKEPEEEPFWLDPAKRRNFAAIALWSIALYLLILLVGFVLASALAMFAFMLLKDRVSWKVNLGMTLLAAGFAYLLIVVFLELPVLDGWLFQLF